MEKNTIILNLCKLLNLITIIHSIELKFYDNKNLITKKIDDKLISFMGIRNGNLKHGIEKIRILLGNIDKEEELLLLGHKCCIVIEGYSDTWRSDYSVIEINNSSTPIIDELDDDGVDGEVKEYVNIIPGTYILNNYGKHLFNDDISGLADMWRECGGM